MDGEFVPRPVGPMPEVLDLDLARRGRDRVCAYPWLHMQHLVGQYIGRRTQTTLVSGSDLCATFGWRGPLIRRCIC